MLLQSRIATACRIFKRINLLNHDRSGYALDFIRNGTKASELHFTFIGVYRYWHIGKKPY